MAGGGKKQQKYHALLEISLNQSSLRVPIVLMKPESGMNLPDSHLHPCVAAGKVILACTQHPICKMGRPCAFPQRTVWRIQGNKPYKWLASARHIPVFIQRE